MNKNIQSYQSLVFHGDKLGRTIGFPTLNLDTTVLLEAPEQGVWMCEVCVSDEKHIGALYFGPRTVKDETHTVLEIHLLDFSREIYGQVVTFSLRQFIRPVIHFASFPDLMKQLKKDVETIRKIHDSTASI